MLKQSECAAKLKSETARNKSSSHYSWKRCGTCLKKLRHVAPKWKQRERRPTKTPSNSSQRRHACAQPKKLASKRKWSVFSSRLSFSSEWKLNSACLKRLVGMRRKNNSTWKKKFAATRNRKNSGWQI